MTLRRDTVEARRRAARLQKCLLKLVVTSNVEALKVDETADKSVLQSLDSDGEGPDAA